MNGSSIKEAFAVQGEVNEAVNNVLESINAALEASVMRILAQEESIRTLQKEIDIMRTRMEGE